MRMEVSDQKNTGIFAEKIASLHQEIQNRRPLVQCITNAVTVNDCANILLAAGAGRDETVVEPPGLQFRGDCGL